MSSTALASPPSKMVRADTPFTSSRGVKFSIRSKLLAGFGSVLVLTALTSAVGIYNLGRMDTLGTEMYVDHLGDVRTFGEARVSLADVDAQTVHAVIDPSNANRVADALAAETSAANVERLMTDFANGRLLDSEKAPVASFNADWKLYQDAYRTVLKTASAGDSAGATKLYLDQNNALLE